MELTFIRYRGYGKSGIVASKSDNKLLGTITEKGFSKQADRDLSENEESEIKILLNYTKEEIMFLL